MEALIDGAADRQLRGPGGEKWRKAKVSLGLMHTEPDKSFRCGPFAVANLAQLAHPETVPIMKAHASVCTDHGTNLETNRQFAKELGLELQAAYRTAGSEIITPSVIHWKLGHFAAVLKPLNGRYLVKDPTFTDDFVISQKAIGQESSGYFLVPAGPLPQGWRAVSPDEASGVWGKGAAAPTTAPPPPCVVPGINCGGSNKQMAGWDVEPSRVNLTIH